ncbi:phosphatase PAP2 family protein [Schaalia vaccimaxillae]|uniref:phosphatase PAP2 family protein n=1 Tax=Schaalia vaccimaxillae TaxID=183916 RepID=UPI0003B5CE48|nr:phosphatase PAP2 family protein [Schaalia vaccimaxillae]
MTDQIDQVAHRTPDTESAPSYSEWLTRSGRCRLIGGAVLLMSVICLGLAIRGAEEISIDLQVLAFFLSERNGGRTTLMHLVTASFDPLISVIWAVGLGALVGYIERSWTRGLVIPLAMALSAAATAGFKEFIARVRPPEADRLVVELSHSFPSGHTTAAAALFVSSALLLLARWKRLRGLNTGIESRVEVRSAPRTLLVGVWVTATLLVVLVAVSRLYLAAHWLTDIIGGALMGSGVALIVFALLVERTPRIVESNAGSQHYRLDS